MYYSKWKMPKDQNFILVAVQSDLYQPSKGSSPKDDSSVYKREVLHELVQLAKPDKAALSQERQVLP